MCPSEIPSDVDRVYAQARSHIAPFRFDAEVAAVFPDMLRRSIPGYETMVQDGARLAARHAQLNTRLFDLGCSLGAGSFALVQALLERQDRDAGFNPRHCTLHAVDNAEAMIQGANRLLERFMQVHGNDSIPTCSFEQRDIHDTPIKNASVVLMNFTLQFLHPEQRPELLQDIRSGLVPGGVLLLSEKISHEDPGIQQEWTRLHHAFKRDQGYSELEISQKRTALENVLRCDTMEAHHERLIRVGFDRVIPWFQHHNFISLLALTHG